MPSLIPRSLQLRSLVALFLLPALLSAWPWSTKWRDVTPEEKAMTEPKIDPEAGVEILISEMEVDQSHREENVYTQYLRLKVFNEQGVRDLQQIDIESGWNQKIRKMAARVIRPDGSIEDIPQEAFYDREILRQGNDRIPAKSFSVQNLEPGTIIEYQFERVNPWGSLSENPFVLNEVYPVHQATIVINPWTGLTVNYVYHRIGDAKLEGKGWKKELTLHDLPAISTEPFLPPYYETVTWLMTSYTWEKYDTSEDYWNHRARSLLEAGKDRFMPRKRAIRRAALEITEGAQDEVEKIERIYRYCVEKIENLGSDWNSRSSEEMDTLKMAMNPADTLDYGYGWHGEINDLFASLAGAAGFDVKFARANDHSLVRFNMKVTNNLGISDYVVAVKVGQGWRVYDPGTLYLDVGKLSWHNEHVPVLLGSADGAEFLTTRVSSSKDNLVTREGDLSLTDDGTLEGSVSITYRGQWAKAMKDRMDGTTQTVREERVEHDLQKVLPLAEVSAIEFTNLRDPTKEVTLNFHLRVPNYGESLSKRVFFQINPFEFTGAQAGGGDSINDHVTFSLLGMDDLLVRTPRFILEKRDFSIYVPFNYAVDDTIKISLPEGFELEEASAPAGDTELDFVDHTLSIGFVKKAHQLIVNRHFRMARCEIGVEHYPAIKELYEMFHDRDQHLMTIRRKDD